MSIFVLAIDLGKVGDYTAMVVIESKGAEDLQVRHINRLEKNTKYTSQATIINSTFKKLQSLGEAYLVIDHTGVGRPVVDMIIDSGVTPDAAVSITGGNNEHQNGYEFTVPKRDLINTVQVMLQNGALRIAPKLPLADQLVKELLGFKMSINKRGHDSYGNDSTLTAHDDLVLAIALGAWYCNKLNTPFFMS